MTKNYQKPAVIEEIALTMDNPVLAGANSVAAKDLSIEHESANDVIDDGSWNSDWE